MPLFRFSIAVRAAQASGRAHRSRRGAAGVRVSSRPSRIRRGRTRGGRSRRRGRPDARGAAWPMPHRSSPRRRLEHRPEGSHACPRAGVPECCGAYGSDTAGSRPTIRNTWPIAEDRARRAVDHEQARPRRVAARGRPGHCSWSRSRPPSKSDVAFPQPQNLLFAGSISMPNAITTVWSAVARPHRCSTMGTCRSPSGVVSHVVTCVVVSAT